MNVKDLEMFGAIARAEIYYAAHPGTPSAVRRPQLSFRSGTWVATLDHLYEGITGLGATVEAALRAFDRQYLDSLRPPERQSLDGAA